ncbi:hypothetical protein AcW1_001318 [Taiwanofungus camphoratus]|nr:hypothetical protein AcW1_001318 [Antrodia cinnamomea]
MSKSSLSSVVSDLVRAQMGTSVSNTVTDEDLDRHVAELILKEAKQKAERYGQDGIRAYLRNGFSESNVPRANKRFLSSIIRNTDDHNKTILRAQALAAQEVRLEREEQERRERRVRAEEAVAAERMRRSMGGGGTQWAHNWDRNQRRDHKRRERSWDRRDDLDDEVRRRDRKRRERSWERFDDYGGDREAERRRRSEGRRHRHRYRSRSGEPRSREDDKGRPGRSRSREVRDDNGGREGRRRRRDRERSRSQLQTRSRNRSGERDVSSDSYKQRRHRHSRGDFVELRRSRSVSDGEPSQSSRLSHTYKHPRSRSPSAVEKDDDKDGNLAAMSPTLSEDQEQPDDDSLSRENELRMRLKGKGKAKAIPDVELYPIRRDTKTRSPSPKAKPTSQSSVMSGEDNLRMGSSSSRTLRSSSSLSRSPSSSPPPTSAPLPSKMDKYFDSSYDPRLDVAPLNVPKVPATGLISDAEFEGWDAMLEIIRLRQQDKEDKKVLERWGISKDKSKDKKRKKGDVELTGSWAEGGTDLMNIQYKKRGSVREWDLGKENV